ncbi:MAG: D-tyrosyl-tRNA(Tyr) deacylase [Candidatus Omnitrophica bacterium]|nr:D-tyrosyl-tRNA(Tyr) deacylase [Candidatus Omnitrophota bacterium]
MKIVIQRVIQAQVSVGSRIVGKIGPGALIFLGVGKGDTEKDADFLADKVVELRMFADAEGKMNVSGRDAGAVFLVVSQFTLYGNCDKGRRPSFDDAASPVEAEKLYEYFVERLRRKGVKTETGEFRAMMEVSLINDGPVTFILESLGAPQQKYVSH